MEEIRLENRISDEDLAQAEELQRKKAEITAEIKKVIVGQERVIEEILIALFCRGHCLLVGVPGLAKTLLISTLAGIMELLSTGSSLPPT
jgi:MoxR-like ATPase